MTSEADLAKLYDGVLRVTDDILGEGTYAKLHAANPDPGVQAAIARSKQTAAPVTNIDNIRYREPIIPFLPKEYRTVSLLERERDDLFAKYDEAASVRDVYMIALAHIVHAAALGHGTLNIATIANTALSLKRAPSGYCGTHIGGEDPYCTTCYPAE